MIRLHLCTHPHVVQGTITSYSLYASLEIDDGGQLAFESSDGAAIVRPADFVQLITRIAANDPVQIVVHAKQEEFPVVTA